MNLLKQRILKNKLSQLIRPSNRKENGLYWHFCETDAHVQMKLDICKWLKKNDYNFWTEAIFTDGIGRCDILTDYLGGVIIEVVNSESELSQEKKFNKYPLQVIFVNANQEFTERLIQ